MEIMESLIKKWVFNLNIPIFVKPQEKKLHYKIALQSIRGIITDHDSIDPPIPEHVALDLGSSVGLGVAEGAGLLREGIDVAP